SWRVRRRTEAGFGSRRSVFLVHHGMRSDRRNGLRYWLARRLDVAALFHGRKGLAVQGPNECEERAFNSVDVTQNCHESRCVFALKLQLLFSQRSAGPGLCFSDARRARLPVFLPSPMERNGAPGGAQEVCETSLAGCARPGTHAKLPGPK